MENAHIQNDAVQLQALQMRQTAEARLRSQRDDETGLAKLQQSLRRRP